MKRAVITESRALTDGLFKQYNSQKCWFLGGQMVLHRYLTNDAGHPLGLCSRVIRLELGGWL